MITVGRSPLSGTSLLAGYTPGSIEYLVLKAMLDSNGRYNFSSEEVLKFELGLRRSIVDAALALNKSRMGFAVFQRTYCNTDFWNRDANGGFRLKSGAIPSAAIMDIYQNGRAYATECATAMMIVYYRAMLEIYGEAMFNSLFKSIYLMNWHTSDPLLRAVTTPRPVNDILLGDRGYFANPDVDPQTPQWQGENVIVLPNNMYYGHGVGIMPAERIIRSLNGNRKPGAARTAYLMSSAGNPDYGLLYKKSLESEPLSQPQRASIPAARDTVRAAAARTSMPVYDGT